METRAAPTEWGWVSLVCAAALAAGITGFAREQPLGLGALALPVTLGAVALPLLVLAARPRPGRPETVVLGVLIGVVGGLLVGLLLHYATVAPFEFNDATDDCGGASEATQNAGLFASSAITLAAACVPAYLVLEAARLAGGKEASRWSTAALTAYPLAIFAACFSVILAGAVTSC